MLTFKIIGEIKDKWLEIKDKAKRIFRSCTEGKDRIVS